MTATKLSANDAARNRLQLRLAQLGDRIAAACAQSHRNPAEITLLAVSKAQTLSQLQHAYALGLREFGESYLQEAVGKIKALPEDCRWHFIGPTQSNKTRAIAENFDWLHSLDRARIADRLNAQRPPQLPPLNVCIQVNVSAEASKAGVRPQELAALAAHVDRLSRLRLRGLMCIPAASEDGATQRTAFRQLRELRDQVLPQARTLSMGMSSDLEAAIAEGSTIVRIGTALFGARHGKTDQA